MGYTLTKKISFSSRLQVSVLILTIFQRSPKIFRTYLGLQEFWFTETHYFLHSQMIVSALRNKNIWTRYGKD